MLATKESLKEVLEDTPHAKNLITSEDATYMGPCIVQAPGAWSRTGPTWLVKNVGWVTYGPGVKRWGTEEGLAELCSSVKPKPELHAEGFDIVPNPNIVFPVSEKALKGNKSLVRVAELTAQADEMA